MRKALITRSVLAALVLLAAPAVHAQRRTRPITAEEETRLLRQELLSMNKRFVAANLPLTDVEAQKFWPVYDRYAAEQALLYDVRDAILTEYADNFFDMTDALALDLTRRWTEADAATIRLRLKYFPHFEKVLPGKKTALFFQIDGRLSVRMDAKLAAEVPLVRP